VTARLPRAHLSDHGAAAEKLAEQLRPGTALGPLVVLQKAPGGEKKGKKGGKKQGGVALLVRGELQGRVVFPCSSKRPAGVGWEGAADAKPPPCSIGACIFDQYQPLQQPVPPKLARYEAHRLPGRGYSPETRPSLCQASRKPSLVAAAASLPSSLEALTVGAVVPGYVAHVTGDAVFVRFLDGLTGRWGPGAGERAG
jgi:hypothetical protein